MISGLHHFEICVSNGFKTAKTFAEKYRFFLNSVRETPSCKQWVMSISKHQPVPAFVITERKQLIRHIEKEDWTSFCCDDNGHNRDSVFNVALQVHDVNKCTERIMQHGGRLINSPLELSDEHGSVQYSTVSSICGNVVHTLVNRTNYSKSKFLPKFRTAANKLVWQYDDIHYDGIDHVTYVCEKDQSGPILDWYHNVLGMKRFLINSEEHPNEGLVIDDNVGLRLKAMEYWKCAETGVQSTDEQGPTFKFVIAESLYKYQKCHVLSFLKEHNGPGIQHIGLLSSKITKTVKELVDSKVLFRYPPAKYYSLPEKIQEINQSDEDIKKLKECGILIDAETDENSADPKYLLQIFTYPIFKEDTFFFEVIQRKGATGFGAGNVTALAKSIEHETNEDAIKIQNS